MFYQVAKTLESVNFLQLMKCILNLFSRFGGLTQHLWVSPLCFWALHYYNIVYIPAIGVCSYVHVHNFHPVLTSHFAVIATKVLMATHRLCSWRSFPYTSPSTCNIMIIAPTIVTHLIQGGQLGQSCWVWETRCEGSVPYSPQALKWGHSLPSDSWCV